MDEHEGHADTKEQTQTSRRNRFLVGTGAVLILALLGTGSFLFARNTADSEDVAAPEETTTTTTATKVPETTDPPVTVPPPTTEATTPAPEYDPAVAHSHFSSLVAQYCDPAMVPDPDLATLDGLGPTFLVTDLEGNVVIFDPLSSTVTSTSGPEGVLPLGYSFGCDPSVFLGTSHD